MNVLLHVPYHAKKAVVVIVDVNIIAGLNTGASTNSCNNMDCHDSQTGQGSTVQQCIYQKEYLQVDLDSKT